MSQVNILQGVFLKTKREISCYFHHAVISTKSKHYPIWKASYKISLHIRNVSEFKIFELLHYFDTVIIPETYLFVAFAL